MVVIFLPTARVACRKQDLTETPSISTVQAPHWPIPQPYFVPVRPIESRSTHNNGVSGSASTEYWTPLTRRVNDIGNLLPSPRERGQMLPNIIWYATPFEGSDATSNRREQSSCGRT